MKTAAKKKCYLCKEDCTEDYYSWSHKNLKLEKDGVVSKKNELLICPNCYNVPLEPHGSFGKNMIARGEGRIENHKADKTEVIRER